MERITPGKDELMNLLHEILTTAHRHPYAMAVPDNVTLITVVREVYAYLNGEENMLGIVCPALISESQRVKADIRAKEKLIKKMSQGEALEYLKEHIKKDFVARSRN